MVVTFERKTVLLSQTKQIEPKSSQEKKATGQRRQICTWLSHLPVKAHVTTFACFKTARVYSRLLTVETDVGGQIAALVAIVESHCRAYRENGW